MNVTEIGRAYKISTLNNFRIDNFFFFVCWQQKYWIWINFKNNLSLQRYQLADFKIRIWRIWVTRTYKIWGSVVFTGKLFRKDPIPAAKPSCCESTAKKIDSTFCALITTYDIHSHSRQYKAAIFLWSKKKKWKRSKPPKLMGKLR